MFISPFKPHWGTNQPLTAAGTSANAALLCANDPQIRVVNVGANIAHIKLGVAGVTATTADYPVPPNSGSILSLQGATHIAYISATGTTLHVMGGTGN